MKSALPVSAGLILAIASGWQHGLITDRWGVPANVAEVAGRVENLDLEVEGWDSTPGGKLGEHTRKLAGAEGYFSRQYTDRQSGAAVNVTVLCGRHGPIALHVPTVCFTNAGMHQLDPEAKTTLPASTDGPDNFWMADYRPPDSHPGPVIRTFWSWSTDATQWSIPDDPRFAFASAPYLYRIYFSAPTEIFSSSSDDENGRSAAELRFDDFIRQFLTRIAKQALAEPT